MMRYRSPSQWLDHIAIGFSALCALHCLTLPLMLVLIPTLGASFLGDAAFHQTMLWVAIPFSILAVFLGCRRHRDTGVWMMAASGLAIMALAAFWGHDLFGEWGEKMITLLGAGILVLGHIRNHHLCRHEKCQHDA